MNKLLWKLIPNSWFRIRVRFGGTIHVPAGTYNLSKMRRGTKLIGVTGTGQDETFLK